MGTRSFADVAPTATTIALNAYIYGYGGHSLVTPHEALKQRWWTDQRIDARVTRTFINSKLKGEERNFLNRQLAFGEGLTDGTYMDWILQRARRLFLILAEIGVPDQIFGCIDDSWDDDDLPISLENVGSLELALENDEALNRRFYDLQFVYLLRELKQGEHIDYGPKEHIPMDHVNTLPPAVSLQIWDRIHFPKRQDEIFTRKKYHFSEKQTGSSNLESFKRDVCQAQALSHEHIASVWGSYTSENAGYVISDFVGEHTLKTFIAHRTAPQYLRVTAADRPRLLCEWMHCLSDALAFLHDRGLAHSAITPSNIIIDEQNRIAFADIGSLRTFQRGKKHTKLEAYDYAAPEQQICKTPFSLSLSPPSSSRGAFGKLRRIRSTRSSSSTYSSSDSSVRSNSISTTTSVSVTPSFSDANGFKTVDEEVNLADTSFSSLCADPIRSSTPRALASPLSHYSSVPSTMIESNTYGIPGFRHDSVRSGVHATDCLIDLPKATPQQSDIFSFACIMLDMITFLVKGKLTDFIKHRSSSVSSLGNKSASHIDSSFHGNSDSIHSWVEHLVDECDKQPQQIYRGLPALLGLIRQMMNQNACRRPTALEVYLRLTEILNGGCEVFHLCCTGRNWNDPSSMYGFDFELSRLPPAPGVKLTTPLSPALASCPHSPVRSPTSGHPTFSDLRNSGLVDYLMISRTRSAKSFSRTRDPVNSQPRARTPMSNTPDRAEVHSSPLPATADWPPRVESRMSMIPSEFGDSASSIGLPKSVLESSGVATLEKRKASSMNSWKRAFARVHS